MTDKVAVIHAGTYKTGTTSIQVMISKNPQLFGQIHYPITGRHPKWPDGHHNIAMDTGSYPAFDPAHGGIAELADELRSTGSERVLLSAEMFSDWWRHPEALYRLKGALLETGYRPEVVLVLRSVTDYIESKYAELTKYAPVETIGTFDDYVRDILADNPTDRPGLAVGEFDYEAMVTGFEAVFGADHVHLIEYDSADATGPFFAVCSELFGVRVAPISPVHWKWGRINTRSSETAARYRLSEQQRAAIIQRFGATTLPGERRSAVPAMC